MERLVQSQPSAKSGPRYHWVCLYDWDENNAEPFEIYVREVSEGIIPQSWFNKPLQGNSRFQKASFKSLNNKVYSFFCKIEYGKINYYPH